MQYDIVERVIKEAEFLIEENATVRRVAERFGTSKSTVHTDLTKRLRFIDGELYKRVRKILFVNLSERHIRGGIATRRKFKRNEQ